MVRDEVWRQMRLGLRAVQAVDADLRLSRADKRIQLLVMHKPSDLLSVGAAGSQEATIAADLLALCSTRILLGQSTRVADALAADLALTDQEQHVLTGWAMERRGRALWKIGSMLRGQGADRALAPPKRRSSTPTPRLRDAALPPTRRRTAGRVVAAPSDEPRSRRRGSRLIAAAVVLFLVLPLAGLGLALVGGARRAARRRLRRRRRRRRGQPADRRPGLVGRADHQRPDHRRPAAARGCPSGPR